MKRILSISTLVIGVAMIALSCKKKCDIPEENTNSGAIIENVIIYPKSGYLANIYGGNVHINDAHFYADQFEVSINGGARVPYLSISGQYDILGNTKNTKCHASFSREVTRDDINGIVQYSVKVHECDAGCDEVRTTENYVLVQKIPSNYFVYFN